jgi:hypothetical protein
VSDVKSVTPPPAAGGQDNGAPGERPEYSKRYHSAFVLEPDGHNVEAVFHGASLTAALRAPPERRGTTCSRPLKT